MKTPMFQAKNQSCLNLLKNITSNPINAPANKAMIGEQQTPTLKTDARTLNVLYVVTVKLSFFRIS